MLVCGALGCTESNLQLHGECGGVLCPSGFHCVVGLPDGGSPNAGFCQQ